MYVPRIASALQKYIQQWQCSQCVTSQPECKAYHPQSVQPTNIRTYTFHEIHARDKQTNKQTNKHLNKT